VLRSTTIHSRAMKIESELRRRAAWVVVGTVGSLAPLGICLDLKRSTKRETRISDPSCLVRTWIFRNNCTCQFGDDVLHPFVQFLKYPLSFVDGTPNDSELLCCAVGEHPRYNTDVVPIRDPWSFPAGRPPGQSNCCCVGSMRLTVRPVSNQVALRTFRD